jgi:hypothetical protein
MNVAMIAAITEYAEYPGRRYFFDAVKGFSRFLCHFYQLSYLVLSKTISPKSSPSSD